MGEGLRHIPVLAGRQPHPGQARAHGGEPVEVVGVEAILDPAQMIGPQPVGQAHGIFDVERHPAIQHQLAIPPDERAGVRHQRLVGIEPGKPVGRAMRAGELHRTEAEFHLPVRVVSGGVDVDMRARRAADQGPDGLPEEFALEVP